MPPPSQIVLWAWERTEDLRFVRPPMEIAVQTGFVSLSGEAVAARGRYFPLRTNAPPATAVVHVEIDRARPLVWTPLMRRRLGAAIRHYATLRPTARVQLDFEVRASERRVLLATIADLRRALPPATRLSMTALASWCDTERWLDAAPVDEIVPMLFRMDQRGRGLERRLAAGGDFADPRCRTALAISTDTPIAHAPAGRRVYLFSPRSWTAGEAVRAQRRVAAWQ